MQGRALRPFKTGRRPAEEEEVVRTKQPEHDEKRDQIAYEENWYRVLKALSLGEPIELGEVPDAEMAELTFDPEVVHRIA
jgi:hypothetical protein